MLYDGGRGAKRSRLGAVLSFVHVAYPVEESAAGRKVGGGWKMQLSVHRHFHHHQHGEESWSLHHDLQVDDGRWCSEMKAICLSSMKPFCLWCRCWVDTTSMLKSLKTRPRGLYETHLTLGSISCTACKSSFKFVCYTPYWSRF